VIVHEWVYGQREWSNTEPGTVGGFARIRYVARVVYRLPGDTEWQIADGRVAGVQRFRRRNGR
jgi:hypothetical protein